MFALRNCIHNEHQVVTPLMLGSFIHPLWGHFAITWGRQGNDLPKFMYSGIYGLHCLALLSRLIRKLISGSTAVAPLQGYKTAAHAAQHQPGCGSTLICMFRRSSVARMQSYIWFKQTTVSDSVTGNYIYKFHWHLQRSPSLTWNKRINQQACYAKWGPWF